MFIGIFVLSIKELLYVCIVCPVKQLQLVTMNNINMSENITTVMFNISDCGRSLWEKLVSTNFYFFYVFLYDLFDKYDQVKIIQKIYYWLKLQILILWY